jgi:hypothetical protein
MTSPNTRSTLWLVGFLEASACLLSLGYFREAQQNLAAPNYGSNTPSQVSPRRGEYWTERTSIGDANVDSPFRMAGTNLI